MWIAIALMLSGVGVLYYLKKTKAVKTEQQIDADALKPVSFGPDTPFNEKGLPGEAYQPVESSKLDDHFEKPIDHVLSDKEAVETLVESEMKDPNKPETNAPEGWYRHANGHMYRIPDPEALWMPEVARKVKKIDMSQFDLSLHTLRNLGTFRAENLVNEVLVFTKTTFLGSIARDTRLNYGVLYLCDSNGNVYDFCISAEGAPTNGLLGNERRIEYKAGSIPGGPYVVQVCDGEQIGASYLTSLILDKQGYEVEMNTKVRPA